MKGGFLICGMALCLAAAGAPPSPREFAARAERGEALTLAFFGGSLTWGANASDPETTSWRGRVMEGLRVRYPKARWRFVNAAIGGTGSELGAFRLERDVLSRNPDFVLLDFTLNDGLAGGRDGKDDFANRTYESIVRTCLAKGVGILPVFLTRKEFTEADDIGFLKRRVQHQEMSRRYGTGFADVLGVLNADFRAGRLDTSRMWPAGMFDTCHPHDAGYAAYADAFFREWDRLLKEDLKPHLPEDWYSMPLTGLRRMDAKELAGGLDGARLEMPYCTANTHDWLCSRWMDGVLVLGNGRRTEPFNYARCEPSAPLKVSFSGTMVALFTEVVPESVPFEVEIDGASRGRRDFGTASISFCRHMVLARDLPEGRHELTIRPVLPANGVGVVRIGAVFAATSPAKTVRLDSGVLTLDRPMVLSAADSGTRFVGAADGSTVISGGMAIKGWADRGGGVWSAPVPRDAWGNPIYFESLFVNGRRAQRARQPNRGFFHLKRANRLSLTLEKPEADLFAAVPTADLPYVHLVGHCKWDVVRRPVGSFDAATGTITIPGAELTRWREPVTNEQYFVENLRSAFDAPGEWFYDVAAGEVLYRPLADETPGTAAFVAPRPGLQTLLFIDGAEDVVFENVTFAHSAPTAAQGPSLYEPHQAAEAAPSAVRVDRSRRIAFRNCRFRGTGGYGLEFGKDCTGNSVVSCVFTDLGAGGVRIGPADGRTLPGGGCVTNAISANAVVRPPAAVSFNLVSNCVFRGGGRFHESGIGVFVGHASDNRIVKNTIEDFFYTGISVGWVWGYSGSDAQRNLIGWNRINRIGQKALSDMGGIYTLATSFGTRIVGNVITDIDAYSYGGWGIYPDEGSEGIVIEGNYVRDTNCTSFHQHYGRNNVVRNNDFGRSRQGPVAVTRSEPHVSVIFEDNLYDGRPLRGDEPAVTKYVAKTVNAVWRSGGGFKPVDIEAAGAATGETAALQSRIDAAWRKGGGVVEVGPGVHRIGGLRLRSNVELHLASNAVLSASRDCGDYDILADDALEPIAPDLLAEARDFKLHVRDRMKPWAGASNPAIRWNNGILRLVGATNVVISGEAGSAIDGNNSYDPEGEEHYRGVHGISAFYSSNVVVRGVELRHTGNWATRFEHCADLTFADLSIRGGHDGVHVRGCDRVRVRRCDIRCGDDAIAGFDNRDVVVEDCSLNTACSAFRFGGTQVRVRRCRIWGPAEWPFRCGLTAAEKRAGVSSQGRGRPNMLSFWTYFADYSQPIRNPPGDIVISDCTVENADRFLHYNFSGNEIWQKGAPLGDIRFERVKATGIGMSLCAYADAKRPLSLGLKDCDISFAKPQAEFIRAAHVGGVALENVSVRGVEGPCVRTWSGAPKIEARDLKGVRPEAVTSADKFSTESI